MKMIDRKKIVPTEDDEQTVKDLLLRLESHFDEHTRAVLRVLEMLKGPRNPRTGAELNRALLGYQWVYRVHVTGRGAYLQAAPGGHQWEYRAVGVLLDLERSGIIDRVRRCECGRWFFARAGAGKKHFCSGVCRQRDNDRDPVKRAARLKRLQDIYAVRKRREREKDERDGFTKPKRRTVRKRP